MRTLMVLRTTMMIVQTHMGRQQTIVKDVLTAMVTGIRILMLLGPQTKVLTLSHPKLRNGLTKILTDTATMQQVSKRMHVSRSSEIQQLTVSDVWTTMVTVTQTTMQRGSLATVQMLATLSRLSQTSTETVVQTKTGMVQAIQTQLESTARRGP